MEKLGAEALTLRVDSLGCMWLDCRRCEKPIGELGRSINMVDVRLIVSVHLKLEECGA